MKNRKFSILLAAIVIGFLSIYATDDNTVSFANNTSYTLMTSINMASGAQQYLYTNPGDQPTQMDIGTDQVASLTIYFPSGGGQMCVMAGSNTAVDTPWGATVYVYWQMGDNGPTAIEIDPNEQN
jgi:hypothetical protein